MPWFPQTSLYDWFRSGKKNVMIMEDHGHISSLSHKLIGHSSPSGENSQLAAALRSLLNGVEFKAKIEIKFHTKQIGSFQLFPFSRLPLCSLSGNSVSVPNLASRNLNIHRKLGRILLQLTGWHFAGAKDLIRGESTRFGQSRDV